LVPESAENVTERDVYASDRWFILVGL
jgi:hypothetical protein